MQANVGLLRVWGARALLIIVFLLLFHAPIRELFRDWHADPNYGHGFIIPPVALFLVWRQRKTLRTLQRVPAWKSGFAVMLTAAMLYLFGTAAVEWFISRMAMLLFLAGLVIYFRGWQTARAVWFPICFLLFMIPLPYIIYYKLTFPMQLLSSKIAFDFMTLSGLTGIREGNILHFPGYTMEVIEACSGLRSLMVLLTLSALLASLSPLRPTGRLVLFISAIPIAIAANVLRLVLTGFIGIFAGLQYAEGFLHEISGLFIFLVGFAGLLLVRFFLSTLATRP